MLVPTCDLNTQEAKAGQPAEHGKTLTEITKQNETVESVKQETGW